jgi:pimeloyl-ACP methyl ester carboxylesterase
VTHFLLLHGFLGQPEQWQWLEAELQGRGHTTRALALPRGSWDDEIEFVHRELRAAGTPTVLVGHSLGGSLVRAYAVRHPDVAFGLGTIAAPPPGYRAKWLDDVGHFDADGRYHPDVAKFLELAFPGAPAELATFTWQQPPLRGAQPEGPVTGSEPRVAILAEDDAAVGAGHQETFAALLRAPMAWVPGGHSPHVRHPALVAELLHNWLTPGS